MQVNHRNQAPASLSGAQTSVEWWSPGPGAGPVALSNVATLHRPRTDTMRCGRGGIKRPHTPLAVLGARLRAAWTSKSRQADSPGKRVNCYSLFHIKLSNFSHGEGVDPIRPVRLVPGQGRRHAVA